MDIALKRNQSFRLPVDLIERLKLLAKQQNRSLNNYVETLLLDAAYLEPNAETIEAMKEAESEHSDMKTPLTSHPLRQWRNPWVYEKLKPSTNTKRTINAFETIPRRCRNCLKCFLCFKMRYQFHKSTIHTCSQ